MLTPCKKFRIFVQSASVYLLTPNRLLGVSSVCYKKFSALPFCLCYHEIRNTVRNLLLGKIHSQCVYGNSRGINNFRYQSVTRVKVNNMLLLKRCCFLFQG